MTIEIEAKHICEQNSYKDTEVRYEKINVEQSSWILEQTWLAAESEVVQGIIERVGNQISFQILLISYCPFCGVNLTDIHKNTC